MRLEFTWIPTKFLPFHLDLPGSAWIWVECPGQGKVLAEMGTLPSLPIPINTLSISAFVSFIRLLYQPSNFKTDIIGWNHIKDLAMTWGFVDITLLAMKEIQTIGLERRSTIRRLPLRTTVSVKYWGEETIDDYSA